MTDREIGQALRRANEDGWKATGRFALCREIERGVKECAPTMTVAEMYADDTLDAHFYGLERLR